MNNITTQVEVDYASAHYHHRKSDNMYEVVARAVVDGESRFIVTDIKPNRVQAVEAVRETRAKASQRGAN